MNNHFKLLYKNLDKVSLRATLKNIEDKLNETENLRIEAVEENERLNNIINELKKELKDWKNLDLDNLLVVIRNIDNKLKRIERR